MEGGEKPRELVSQLLGNKTPSLLPHPPDCREDLATPESPDAPGDSEDSQVLGKVVFQGCEN